MLGQKKKRETRIHRKRAGIKGRREEGKGLPYGAVALPFEQEGACYWWRRKPWPICHRRKTGEEEEEEKEEKMMKKKMMMMMMRK